MARPPSPYARAITSDPVYQAMLRSVNANTQRARNSLRDSIRQLVISSGYDPTGQLSKGLAPYASDIDPATHDAALANQFSTRAQIQDALFGGQHDLEAGLAARGMAGSGGEATGQSVLNMNFQKSTHDALQDLLAKIGTGVSGYADTQAQQQQNLWNTGASVAGRLAQQPGGPLSIPGVPAFRPRAATGAYRARSAAAGKALQANPSIRQYFTGV